MRSALGEFFLERDGKTDADLIYMFYKKTINLEDLIKEKEDVIRSLSMKLDKLNEFLTKEECKKAEYGNPEEEIVYVQDIKKEVFGKSWVSADAKKIFEQRLEKENELNRSVENDKGGSEE